MSIIVQMDSRDNVVVCLRGAKAGDRLCEGLPAITDIPIYHKAAIRDIPAGSAIIKYGEVIGSATRDIRMGEHVHVHNIESNRGRGDREKGKAGC